MRLLYHPLAESEIIEAASFYESRSPGLGEGFLGQLADAAIRVQYHPHRWPVVESDIRRIMLKRFPFGIYFRVVGDTIRVLTVKHHRRHPGYGTDRT